MDTLYMGFARADITPLSSARTIGFGRADEWSKGVESPLSAQVAVFKMGKETCCLAAIDHIGFGKAHANALRDRMGAYLNVSREKIMLCFSHTHSAPNDDLEREYAAFADERIMGALTEATGALAPALIAWGQTKVNIGVNRRAGEKLDDRAGALLITDEKGARRLLILRLTAHCNCFKADNYLISPDYFGHARTACEAALCCPAMCVQGACGDVAPRFFSSRINPPDADDTSGRYVRAQDAPDRMASEIVRAAREILLKLSLHTPGVLSMESRFLPCFSKVPDEEEAQKIASDAKKFVGSDPSMWLNEVSRLRKMGISRQQTDLEVQSFSLGEGCLCGVSEEIMNGISLRASALRGDENFYLSGYVNGCGGYLPTAEEFDRGGYEVYWSLMDFFQYYGRVYPFDRDTAERLARFAALPRTYA